MRVLVLLVAACLWAGCSNPHGGQQVTPDVDTGDTGEPQDTEVVEDDADGDGFTEGDGDCDDADPAVYPGAPELCDDKDNDCDGTSDADLDADVDGVKDCADACPIYVDLTATAGARNGTYADPFLAVQDAIEAAGSCDQIRVRPGSYDESIDYLGKDLEIASTKGPGFTTLHGDGSQSVVTIASGEGEGAVLRGFSVTGGGGAEGAGIYVLDSDPTIEGNQISGNNANTGLKQGGGIYLKNSNAYIVDNEITRNDAGYGGTEDGCDGGGFFIRGGAPTIERNLVRDNSAGDGGGLWLARSDAAIVANRFVGNRAYDTDLEKGGQGGGLDIQIGTEDTIVSGNVIVENTASTHGGGIAVYEYSADEGDPEISNNTIAFNAVTETSYGAGFVGWSLTRSRSFNNIVYANHGTGAWLNGTTSWRYNDVHENRTGAGALVNYGGDRGSLAGVDGNVDVDPRFVKASDNGDWSDDDWALRGGSPALNAGDPAVKNRDGSRSHLGATGGPFGM